MPQPALSAADALHVFLVAVYAVSAAVLALHGLHMAVLSVLALRATPPSFPVPDDDALPHVTVQLPLYNEAAVAARVVAAAAAFDYPRFDIQVLDDSTDETSEIVAEAVARLRESGLDVVHLRRAHRAGFKAGALAAGLARSDAPFVAVFDADFVPPPDLLRRLAAPLLVDARAAFAQARWTHRNADASWLTRLQAVALDAHFAVEQFGRSAAGLAFTFNGTAGMWRRAALDDAGGWRGDTLTEDFDLSLRAYAAGWQGVFLDDALAPADLPTDAHALRAQQRRWARGNTEVARLVRRPLLGAPLPLRLRALAAVHLAAPLTFVAGFGMLLSYAPAVLTGGLPVGVQLLGAVGFLGIGVEQTATAHRRGAGAWRWLWRGVGRTVVLMTGMTALAPACALAVGQALGRRRGVFERTPKTSAAAPRRYRTARPAGLMAVEAAVFAFALAGAALLVAGRLWAWLPFQMLLVVSTSVWTFQTWRGGEKAVLPVQRLQADRTFPVPASLEARRSDALSS